MTKRKKAVTLTAPAGNHAPDWEPTSRDAPVVLADERTGAVDDDFRDAGRQASAEPSKADMRDAFGEATGCSDGSPGWSIDMTKRENRGKWKELSAAKRRIMLERSGRMNAKPKARLKDRNTGEERVVLAEFEDLAGRMGNLKANVRWSGMRVERGVGGMLFREERRGVWTPTGRKCLGTPLDGSDPFDLEPVQYSPTGEVWLRDSDGEWHLGRLPEGEQFGSLVKEG